MDLHEAWGKHASTNIVEMKAILMQMLAVMAATCRGLGPVVVSYWWPGVARCFQAVTRCCQVVTRCDQMLPDGAKTVGSISVWALSLYVSGVVDGLAGNWPRPWLLNEMDWSKNRLQFKLPRRLINLPFSFYDLPCHASLMSASVHFWNYSRARL